MSNKNVIKVLLVDDHALVRKGIISLLEDIKDIQVIAEASTGEEAIKMVPRYKPDIILMDIQMPGIGGLEAARKILIANNNSKILALTIHDSEIYPLRLLESGALGYLTKNSSAEELEQAIRKVYAGERYVSPSMAQKLALKRFSSDGTPFDCLSKRELQIVMMVTSGEKAQKIAEILHLSPKTVNTYRYRIYEKLGIKSDVDLTHLAIRYGIIKEE